MGPMDIDDCEAVQRRSHQHHNCGSRLELGYWSAGTFNRLENRVWPEDPRLHFLYHTRI